MKPDGTLANGRVFFDMTSAPGEDAIDGLKVDQQGNVYVSGPGGLWILSPAGTHLGTIVGPEHPHNFAWGGADGRTLYLTARPDSYRIRLNVLRAAHAGSRVAHTARDAVISPVAHATTETVRHPRNPNGERYSARFVNQTP